MTRDPDRKKPQHPEGLPALDDAPVFLAPAIDVRPHARAQSELPEPDDSEITAVGLAMAVPVEERVRPLHSSEDDSETTLREEDASPQSAAPATIDWDRFSKQFGEEPVTVRTPPVLGGSEPPPDGRTSITIPDRPSITIPDRASNPPTQPIPSIVSEERDALLRDLGAIGALDERADRTVDRAVGARATLARARALRFRLALLDGWPTDVRPADASSSRAFDLDLCIDAMLLVALADGASGKNGPALPVVRVMAEELRALRADLPRTALRDRGASAIARLTISGFAASLAALSKTALATPPEARKLALELAARAALVPHIDEHRLGALHDLEKALSLPTGSVAPAIEGARRRIALERSRQP